MKCNVPGWAERIEKCAEAMKFINEFEQKFEKGIVLDDIQQYPSLHLVNDFLGTMRATKNEISIYINAQQILKHDQRTLHVLRAEMSKNGPRNLTPAEQSAVNLFLHTLCHELLHYEMDSEEYPVTRNHVDFSQDASVSKLGTLLQDAIIHGELARRQIQRGLPFSGQKPTYEVLINGLLSANIPLDDAQKKKIHSLCDIGDGGIDAKTAFERLYELIELLGLDDRLMVDLPSV